jgi:bacterioferritin
MRSTQQASCDILRLCKVAILNEVLKAELTAINQYFLHAEMCENWGYQRMAKQIRKESIEEMQHAEILMERILYLDGAPNMTDYLRRRACPRGIRSK